MTVSGKRASDSLLGQTKQKPVTSFGRVFHKEGDLMKYNKKLKGQVRYCFLFNDMLIYTQKKGARYQFKGEIPLNGSLVSDINAKGEAGTKLASMGKDVNVGFQITHLEAKVTQLNFFVIRSPLSFFLFFVVR